MRFVWDPIIVAFLVTRLALTRLPLDPPHRPYRLQARDESAQQPRFRRRFSRRRGGDAYRREIWSRSRPDGGIFNGSTGGNNTIEVKLKQFIISKTFNAGFPLSSMAKDVRCRRACSRHRSTDAACRLVREAVRRCAGNARRTRPTTPNSVAISMKA